MTVKEAEDIIKRYQSNAATVSAHNVYKASGYLEAHEKALRLAKKVDGVLGLLEQEDIEDIEKLLTDAHDELGQALADWEREK